MKEKTYRAREAASTVPVRNPAAPWRTQQRRSSPCNPAKPAEIPSTAPLISTSWPGPRTVHLQRTENGFGFTLRHFIVYPPEKFKTDKESKNFYNINESKGDLPPNNLEPMDTMFVKHIKEGGPAHRAGLSTGDRIVSVNGETITGKTYSEVVQLIQKSRNALQLLVVPKEDDILQLYFPGTAYRCDIGQSSSTSSMESARDNEKSDFGPANKVLSTSDASGDRLLRTDTIQRISSNKGSSHCKSLSSLSSTHIESLPWTPLTGNVSSAVRQDLQVCEDGYYQMNHQGIHHLKRDIEKNCNQYCSSSSSGSDCYPSSRFSEHKFQNSTNKHGSAFPFLCSELQYSSYDSLEEEAASRSERMSQSLPSEGQLPLRHSRRIFSISQCNEKDYNESVVQSQMCNVGDSTRQMSNQSDVSSGKIMNHDLEKISERIKISIEQREKFLLNSSASENVSTTSVRFGSPPQPSHYYGSSQAVPTNESQMIPSKSDSSSSMLNSAVVKPSNSNFKPWSALASEKPQSKDPVLHLQSIQENPSTFTNESSCFLSPDYSYTFGVTHRNPRVSKERPYLTKVNSVPESSSPRIADSNYLVVPVSKHISSNVQKNDSPKRMVPAMLRKANSLDSSVMSSRIHHPRENQHVMRLHLVSQRAKLFESGSLENEARNRMNLYRNELSRLTSKCQTPSVSDRAAQFESLSSSQDMSKSDESECYSLEIKGEKKDSKWQRSYSDSVSCGLMYSPAPIKNKETCSLDNFPKQPNFPAIPSLKIYLSSKKVPDRSQGGDDHTSIDNGTLYPKISNESSASEDEDFPRRKAVRQNSYLQAVRSPYRDVTTAATVTNTTTSLTNTITKTLATPTCESHMLLAGIVPERRAFFEDDVRGFRTQVTPAYGNADRGSSYGGCGGGGGKEHGRRGAKDDGDEKTETPLNNRTHNIQKLKAFFGEKTPQIIEAAEKHTVKELALSMLPLPSKEIFKEGWLHCKTALVDGKRSADRSWKQLWGSLRAVGLSLTKERLYHESTSGLDEQPIVIRPRTVDVAHNYTKKKNVFRLCTMNGSEYLMQAEDNDEMHDWIHCLQNNFMNENVHLETHEFPNVHAHDHYSRLSPQPLQKGIKKLTSFRNRSPTSHSPVIKSRKTTHGEDASQKPKTWKGKVVKTIKKIHGSSSSSSLAVPEGITINVPLEDCPSSSVNEFVPLLVELCVSIVEARGLEMVGIYRVPGNTAAVTALLEAVNKGFDHLNLQDPRWNDVNVISSVLKAFFRKLPDPLIPSFLYPFFIAANKIEDVTQRLYTLKKLLHELPDHNYESVKFIIQHLRKVVAYSPLNKMEARNLAIVFGPTLVRAIDDSMATMVTDMSHQCCIIETLITKGEWFFDHEYSFDLSLLDLSSNSTGSNSTASSASNLLVNSIPKLEANSNRPEVQAKDIISSIISAANRKVQLKAKKFSVCSAPAMGENFGFEERDIDREVELQSKHHQCGGRDMGNAAFATSARPGSIKSREHQNGHDFNVSKRTASVDTIHNYENSNRKHGDFALDARQDQDAVVTTSDKVGDEVVFRTYAGLSASTQERIRKFETETRALLQRDLNRQRRENEWRQIERQRIEDEWQRAKQELEQDDPLDRLADNFSASSKTVRTSMQFAPRSQQCNHRSNSTDSSSNSSSDFSRECIAAMQNPNAHIYLRHNPGGGDPTMRQSVLPAYNSNRKAALNFKAIENSCFYIDQNFDLSSDSSNQEKPATNSRVPLRHSEWNGTLRRVNSLETVAADPAGSKQVNFSRSGTNKSKRNADDAPAALATNSFGSLDSLHGICEKDISSYTSSEDSDLLSSITSTLNQRLSSLKESPSMLNSVNSPPSNDSKNVGCGSSSGGGGPTSSVTRSRDVAPKDQYCRYRDPSLHRNQETSPQSHQEVPTRPPRDAKGKRTQNESANSAARPAKSAEPKKNVQGGRANAERPAAPSVEVQFHRNEHTLITATVSTSKHTVTSSATTAVITSTIVSSTVDGAINSNNKSNKPISSDDVGNKNNRNKELKDASDKDNSCDRSKTARNGSLKLAQETSPPVRCRTSGLASHLKRRHTVGGMLDFDKFQFFLEKVLSPKESQATAWDRLQPGNESNEKLQSGIQSQRSLKNWLERERLRLSSPNLTPARLDPDLKAFTSCV